MASPKALSWRGESDGTLARLPFKSAKSLTDWERSSPAKGLSALEQDTEAGRG